jgi:hypothetical protein
VTRSLGQMRTAALPGSQFVRVRGFACRSMPWTAVKTAARVSAERVIAVGLVLAFLVACSGGGSESRPTRPAPTSSAQTTADLSDLAATNYKAGYETCSASPPDKLAADLGVATTDPPTIAHAYSTRNFPAPLQEPPFGGCIDALTDQPSRVG